MKLTIERAALLRSLGHVQSVVERRSTIPILSNVLLRAKGNELALAATDMDLEIVESAAAEVYQAGGVTAPAHTLFDIVRKLPDGASVELESSEATGVLTLRAGRSVFRLPALPVADFPQLSGGELPFRFHLGASDLRMLIDRTRFAISTEETRYYLNGIYLHAVQERTAHGDQFLLRAVATDGHRLARMDIAQPEGAAGMPGVIVPRKVVNEVRKLIDEAADVVEISVSTNKIRFAVDTAVITSKLIDGTFPDYQRVIPTGNEKILAVGVKEFAAAVDRVATISVEKSRAVKLEVAANNLTVSASSPDAGQAREEMSADYDASPMDIGFNSRYVLDITGQIEGSVIRFRLADAAAPAIVEDSGNPAALFVLMPMRV